MDDILILADEMEVKRIEVFFQGRVHLDYDERGKCSVVSWHANHARARSSDSRYVLLPREGIQGMRQSAAMHHAGEKDIICGR